MKNPIIVISIALATLFFAPNSFARKTKDRAEERKIREEKVRPLRRGHDSCDVVKDACIAAGFKKHGPAGKDLRKDCVEVLFLGLSVPRIHVHVAIIESCKSKKNIEL